MFGIGLPELIVLFGILLMLAAPVAIVLVVIWLTRRNTNKSVIKGGYMFCTKCGTQNDDNASNCVRCGNVLQHPRQFGRRTSEGMTVPNYLVQAILVTIFCCVPFGIPAIVFAAQVNSKLTAGDYNGAVEASKKAKTWCWICFGVGLGFGIIYLMFAIIGILMESSS